jgi:hypothetical protein
MRIVDSVARKPDAVTTLWFDALVADTALVVELFCALPAVAVRCSEPQRHHMLCFLWGRINLSCSACWKRLLASKQQWYAPLLSHTCSIHQTAECAVQQ